LPEVGGGFRPGAGHSKTTRWAGLHEPARWTPSRWAFHDTRVPIHHNERVAAAALRADRPAVQQAGRWLVRHSPDRCSALIGLALLAADWAEEDIGLITIIGLLSDRFAPLAAAALKHRRGGAEALLWLAGAPGSRIFPRKDLCSNW
jgi:hypothetical protein